MPYPSARHIIHPLLKEGLSTKEINRRTGYSESAIGRHRIQVFGRGPTRPSYDWTEIQRYYDAGHGFADCQRRFGFDYSGWSKAIKAGRLFADPNRRQFRKAILVGQRFEKLTTIKCVGSTPDRRGVWWLCRCDCGREIEIPGSYLNRGAKKSCGCARRPSGPKNAHWKGHGEISASFWNQMQLNAKSRDIQFDISIGDAWILYLRQGGKCSISGESLRMLSERDVSRTASLDRIDSTKGYVPGNVQWVHKDVNTMKLDHDQGTFLNWIDTIYHFQHPNNHEHHP